MARDFRLPDVGEGIKEAEIIRWMVEVGDPVDEDEGVLEVETDKAIIEIPSPVSGEVSEKLYDEGETAEVGDVIIRFETDTIQTPETDGSTAGSAAADEAPRDQAGGGTSKGGRVFAAPSTRRLAREKGVDIQEVEGSGPGGRVTQADVERAAEQRDDMEDLPKEVAKRKAAKEFERRKWMDDEEETEDDRESRVEDEPPEADDSGYETVFQDEDEDDEAVDDDAIIVGDEADVDEDTEPSDDVTAEDRGDKDRESTSSDDGEDEADEEEGLTPEFGGDVDYPEEDDEDDGLTPEFSEEVAYPEEDDEDDGLAPEFERDSTAVDRTEMAPEFGDEDEDDFDGEAEAEETEGREPVAADEEPPVEGLEATEDSDEKEEDDDEVEVEEADADEEGDVEPEAASPEAEDVEVEGEAAEVVDTRSRDVVDGEAGEETETPVEKEEEDAVDSTREPSDGFDDVPYTGVRRRIGERLTEAVERPLVTHHDDVDVTRLQEVQDEVDDVTYTPFVVKACVAALQNHPMLNSSLDEEDERIRVYDDCHVGVATATDDGLLVPVLRDADEKDIAELSKELDDLVERARDREIQPEEMKGSTFTVTNVGAIGGEYSTPIVNGDEAAILALGEVRRKPRVVDDEVKPRYVVNLSLTFDHRIVDGADAARFTNEVRRYLRKPALLLVD